MSAASAWLKKAARQQSFRKLQQLAIRSADKRQQASMAENQEHQQKQKQRAQQHTRQFLASAG
jgi:hypothetical protein